MDEQPHQPPEHRDTATPAHGPRPGSTGSRTSSTACPPPPRALGGHAGRHLRGRCARHGGPVPGVAPPVAAGGFPWVTLLVNLTGSFAIGLLIPLTEHVAPGPAWSARSPSSASWGDGRPIRPWRSTPRCWPSTVTSSRALAYLAATVAGGLALVVAGHSVGRRMTES